MKEYFLLLKDKIIQNFLGDLSLLWYNTGKYRGGFDESIIYQNTFFCHHKYVFVSYLNLPPENLILRKCLRDQFRLRVCDHCCAKDARTQNVSVLRGFNVCRYAPKWCEP